MVAVVACSLRRRYQHVHKHRPATTGQQYCNALQSTLVVLLLLSELLASL